MIKMSLLPVFADMARCTVLSQASVVHVIRPVTAYALSRRIAARCTRFMTTAAVKVCMRTLQLEISQRMIEFVIVLTENVGIPSFMVRP